MAEPDWNPDTGGRSLAEILREAGIESASRTGRRRRWDDPEEAGLRQRRAEAAAAGRGEYGRRMSDQVGGPTRPTPEGPESGGRQAISERVSERVETAGRRRVAERHEDARPVPGPSTAAIPGLRPDRKPGVPTPSTQHPAAPHPSAPHPSAPLPGMPFGNQRSDGRRAGERGAEPAAAQRTSRRTSAVDEHPSTGPIPVVRADALDAELDESTPRESALAWLRFAGELVIALAAGVGIYFAATVLWEMVPHLALLLTPLAVTGLVSGVGAWRRRQDRDPMGARLLAILVFAGTLLTIAPAAGLLAGA